MTDAIFIDTGIQSSTIAVIDLRHYGQESCKPASAETLARAEAHARLIAAAPEMREILERILASDETELLADVWDSASALLARIDGSDQP